MMQKVCFWFSSHDFLDEAYYTNLFSCEMYEIVSDGWVDYTVSLWVWNGYPL